MYLVGVNSRNFSYRLLFSCILWHRLIILHSLWVFVEVFQRGFPYLTCKGTDLLEFIFFYFLSFFPSIFLFSLVSWRISDPPILYSISLLTILSFPSKEKEKGEKIKKGGMMLCTVTYANMRIWLISSRSPCPKPRELTMLSGLEIIKSELLSQG